MPLRSFSISVLLVSAMVAGGRRAAAQDAATPPAEPNTPAALASTPAPPSQTPGTASRKPEAEKSADRQITDLDIAHALVDSLPKFDPAKPDTAAPPDEADEADQPKNHIIRLPAYIVNGQRPPPVFAERNISTKQGLEALAVKRYMTEFDQVLNGETFFFNSGSPGDRALQMYREDERLANLADLDATAASIARGGDAAEGQYIKQAAQDTYRRTTDWGWGAKDSLGLGADQGH
jgi:hypothetical protein